MYSRKYSEVFYVDDIPLLSPDQGVEISENDLDSADSGRDESGVMHRFVVRESVRTWGFVYASLNAEDYQYIKSLFKGKSTFTFKFLEPDGTESAVKAYCSKKSITLRDLTSGGYKNLKFNIIEC